MLILLEMSHHSARHELNISKITEKYKGKTIEELFPNHSIIHNSMGFFMEISWHLSDMPCQLNLASTKKNLLNNLKSIERIGEITEKELMNRSMHAIPDLAHNLKYQHSAEKMIKLIRAKDYLTFSNKKNVYDIDVLFCFNPEELLFLDIETLGLYLAPIIMIGCGFFQKEGIVIQVLFARDLEEEIAICEHLRRHLLPNYKCFITYNGKSFDIPFLANRFLYFFEENPMIYTDEELYQTINTRFHHVDLYHNCRRQYKDEFSKFNLTAVEEGLLKRKRKNDVQGSFMNAYYRMYLRDRIKYSGLIKKCIEHNFQDIYLMPLILKKLIESKHPQSSI